MNHLPARRRQSSPARPWHANWALSRRAGHGLGLLVVSLAVFAVYLPAAEGPFIFDDSATIVNNASIRQLWPLAVIGEGTGPLDPPPETPVYGRPLVNLSFAVNYHFGALDPRGYRVVHMILHCLSACLLWAIVARTLRSEYFRGAFDRVADLLSFTAALIWAVHPLVTESVVYVTQRTELMMGFLYLATLYCAIRYWSASRSAPRTSWLVMAILSCLAGMLCKEMIASAPAMVLLFERTFVARSFRHALARSWRLYAGLALVWFVAIGLNYDGPRTPMAGFDLGVPAYQWWLTQAKVFFLYLKLAVWPWPLVIHYDIPYLHSVTEAWPWFLAASLYGVAALVLVWRRLAVGFVMTWVVAVLSPTLVIPLVGEIAAERRMYVPLAALMPLLIVGGYRLLKVVWHAATGHSRQTFAGTGPIVVATVANLVIAIGLGQLSARRLVAYQDGITLWHDAVLHQPHNPLVRANLGISLAEEGRFVSAKLQFEEWVRLEPDSHWAHYNLARSLEGSQQPRDAMQHYRRVLELQSDHAASHYNLARLLESDGEWPRAIRHYRQAIDAQPDFSAAHTNLGLLLLDLGKADQAIKHLTVALQEQEDLVNYEILVLALKQTNRRAEAIEVAERGLALAHTHGETAMIEQLDTMLESLRNPTNTR